jgi:hypothetical protein
MNSHAQGWSLACSVSDFSDAALIGPRDSAHLVPEVTPAVGHQQRGAIDGGLHIWTSGARASELPNQVDSQEVDDVAGEVALYATRQRSPLDVVGALLPSITSFAMPRTKSSLISY